LQHVGWDVLGPLSQIFMPAIAWLEWLVMIALRIVWKVHTNRLTNTQCHQIEHAFLSRTCIQGAARKWARKHLMDKCNGKERKQKGHKAAEGKGRAVPMISWSEQGYSECRMCWSFDIQWKCRRCELAGLAVLELLVHLCCVHSNPWCSLPWMHRVLGWLICLAEVFMCCMTCNDFKANDEYSTVCCHFLNCEWRMGTSPQFQQVDLRM